MPWAHPEIELARNKSEIAFLFVIESLQSGIFNVETNSIEPQ